MLHLFEADWFQFDKNLSVWLATKGRPVGEVLARAGFSHDLTITAQGLNKRFTEKAATLVKRVLEEELGKS